MNNDVIKEAKSVLAIQIYGEARQNPSKRNESLLKNNVLNKMSFKKLDQAYNFGVKKLNKQLKNLYGDKLRDLNDFLKYTSADPDYSYNGHFDYDVGNAKKMKHFLTEFED